MWCDVPDHSILPLCHGLIFMATILGLKVLQQLTKDSCDKSQQNS